MDVVKREEIRGLFTLSLLALLIIIRTSYDKLGLQEIIVLKIPFIAGAFLELNLLECIDLIIFCWMVYAILMILSFSDDLISSTRIRDVFRLFGLAFLVIGPIMLTLLFFIVLTSAYVEYYFPNSVYILLSMLAFVTIVSLILRKYKVHLSIEPKKP